VEGEEGEAKIIDDKIKMGEVDEKFRAEGTGISSDISHGQPESCYEICVQR